ncbi:MAG: MFS transporter [Lacisediminihabitans sp.]
MTTTHEPAEGIRSAHSPFGATPRQLLGVLATWIYALLPANLVPYIIGGLVGELGVSLTLAGIIATAMTLANAAGVLALRPVVSRGHRATVARIGVAVLVVAFAIAALFPSATIVMIALVVGGLGSGVLIAAATASVSAVENPDRATTVVITVNRLIVALTFLLLPLLGGGIRSMLVLLVVFGVIAFLGSAWLSARVLPPTGEDKMALPADPTPVADVRGARAVAWLLAVAFAAWTISEEGVYGVLSVLMVNNLPLLDAAGSSAMIAGGVFSGLLGALVSPLILRFLGRSVGLSVLFAASIVAKLGMMVGQSEGLYITAVLVWGFAFGATIPLVFGLAAKLTRSGSANVLVNGVYVIGVALGPLVSTQLLEVGGLGALAVAMTALGVLSAVAIIAATIRSRVILRQTWPEEAAR